MFGSSQPLKTAEPRVIDWRGNNTNGHFAIGRSVGGYSIVCELPAEYTPRFGERARIVMRLRHLSPRTEDAYLGWMRRYYEFHERRDPAELGAEHVTAFLNILATQRHVSASTQNQALASMLFLYREVLNIELPWLDDLVHAKSPERLPVVLAREEVRAVLARMQGVPRLIATLLYGAGLRLLECHRLRVKDVDFINRNQIQVRRGMGDNDRVTRLPGSVRAELAAHLERVRAQHARDLASGSSWVELPGSLAKKLPNAEREWAGSGSSRQRGTTSSANRVRSGATTYTRRTYSMRCAGLCSSQELQGAPHATHSVTPSRHICWRTAATSERYRSYSATRMLQRR